VDFFRLHKQREGHVVPHQLELGFIYQIGDVFFGASEKVVDKEHVLSIGEQTLAKMVADKACAPLTRMHFL